MLGLPAHVHALAQRPRYEGLFKAQAVAAYQERMSTRGIRRTFGVCYQTLMVWVGKK